MDVDQRAEDFAGVFKLKPVLLDAERRLPCEWHSQVKLSRRAVGEREVVHGQERVGVAGTELRTSQGQHLLEARQGQIQLVVGLVGKGEVVQGGEVLHVLRTPQ